MNKLPDSHRRIIGPFVLLAAVVLSGYPLLALADFSVADWQYVKSITLPPDLGKAKLAEFVVDSQVFAIADKGLGDLRIVRDGEEEVPYQLTITRGGRIPRIRGTVILTGSIWAFSSALSSRLIRMSSAWTRKA